MSETGPTGKVVQLNMRRQYDTQTILEIDYRDWAKLPELSDAELTAVRLALHRCGVEHPEERIVGKGIRKYIRQLQDEVT